MDQIRNYVNQKQATHCDELEAKQGRGSDEEYGQIHGFVAAHSSIGFCDEQSIEAFHKVCARVLRRYSTQRGTLGVRYALDQLWLITSPKYQ